MSGKEKEPRLLLLITELTGGGAQRAMSTMANYWADHGRDVTLVTLWSTATDFYVLSRRVRRVALGLAHPSIDLRQSLAMTCRRLWALRREFRALRPDTVISFMDTNNMLALLATRGLSLPVVVSERIDPRHHEIGKLRSWVRRRVYPWSDAVVVQSEDVAGWMRTIVRSEGVRIIPNPVRPLSSAVSPESRPANGDRVLVFMGRLTHQKQLDLLIRAFAHLAPQHPDWTLIVLGEGPERTRLERLAADLGVAAKVRWLGLVPEPEHVLRRCDLFVLPSRYEGFPNALLEAMACGLAVISFDCPSGPRDIIRHGIDGLLVADQDGEALTAAMKRLMSDTGERERLAANAVKVSERFGLDQIMTMWDDLVYEVVSRARGVDRA